MYALIASLVLFLYGCSKSVNRERDSCVEYVDRLNRQSNQEGRGINSVFPDVDFGNSRSR